MISLFIHNALRIYTTTKEVANYSLLQSTPLTHTYMYILFTYTYEYIRESLKPIQSIQNTLLRLTNRFVYCESSLVQNHYENFL